MKFLLLLLRLSVAGVFTSEAFCEEVGGDKITFPPGSIECGADGSPLLYAFENGLGFGTDVEEAAFLKKQGYAGVSQVGAGAEKLADKIAAYNAAGLRVLSVYRDVGESGADAADLAPFKGKDGIIELTVKEMKPGTLAAVRETCLVAEGLGMRVAIYPHYGFGIATIPQAMDLISKVDYPNLGVMFNLCHFLRGENVADLEKVIKGLGDRLFAVSVSGADADGRNWSDLIKPLDEGKFSQKRLLETLADAEFEGSISLQCFGVPGDKRKNLERSMEAWKKLTEISPQ